LGFAMAGLELDVLENKDLAQRFKGLGRAKSNSLSRVVLRTTDSSGAVGG
jgi:hypothetical protein